MLIYPFFEDFSSYLILNQYLNDEIATLLQRIADLFRQRLQNINIMVIQANRFKIISKDEYYELLSLLTKMKEIVGKQIRLLSSNGYLFDQFEAFVRSNNIGYPVKIPTERCGSCCSKIDFFDFSKTHSYQLCMRTCPICGIYSIQVGSEKFIQHYSVTNEAGNTAFSIATTGYEFYYFRLYDKLMALLHMSNSESVVRTSECTRTACLPMYTLIRLFCLVGMGSRIHMENLSRRGNNWVYLLSVVSDNLGSSLMTFVLPLIVLDLTGSGIHLSIISSFETLPFLLLGLPFGAIVDRCDIRKVLIRSDAIRFGGYALLAAVLSARSNATVTLIAIYLVTLVIGCTNVFSSVSEITFISYFVSKSDYSKMNSIVYGIQYTAGLLIPLAGGALYSVVPMGLLALICAACFLLSAGAILLMRVGSSKGAGGLRGPVPAAVRTVIGDTRQGLSYLKTRRVVLYPLVLAALFNLLTGNFQNDSLVIMRKSLSFTSGQVGLVMSVTAMGALAGTFIVNLLNRSFKFETVLIANFLVQMCFRLLFVAFGNIFAVAATLFVVDLCQSVLNIIIITNRQNLVETRYLGRVTSIYKAVLIGVNSLGFIYGGTLSNTFGPRNAVLWAGVEILILTMIGIGAYAQLNKERTTDE